MRTDLSALRQAIEDRLGRLRPELKAKFPISIEELEPNTFAYRTIFPPGIDALEWIAYVNEHNELIELREFCVCCFNDEPYRLHCPFCDRMGYMLFWSKMDPE